MSLTYTAAGGARPVRRGVGAIVLALALAFDAGQACGQVAAPFAPPALPVPGDVVLPPVVPGQQPARERLRLADVLAAVLGAHPELAAAQARYDAALQRAPQAEVLPDPMISTGYTSAGAPYPGAGLGRDPNASLGVMVSQGIPYPGKRALRAEILRREADAERQQVDAARLSLVARTTQAYVRLAAAWQVDDVLRSSEDLLTLLQQVSEGRYAVGQAAQQDVIRAQTQVSVLALRREQVAGQRRALEGDLNSLLNRAPDAPIGRPEDLEPVAPDEPLPALVARATAGAPMLRRDESMVGRSMAAVDAAKREFRPDFAVSGGYSYMGSMPDMFEVRFDVVVPLQRARRRAAVAERERALDADRHALDATRLALQRRVQEDYQMAATASRLATLYRDALLPQARLALESSIASYQTGAVDFLSVLTNFGSVLEYEIGVVEQLTDLHLAMSRLEEMAAATLRP